MLSTSTRLLPKLPFSFFRGTPRGGLAYNWARVSSKDEQDKQDDGVEGERKDVEYVWVQMRGRDLSDLSDLLVDTSCVFSKKLRIPRCRMEALLLYYKEIAEGVWIYP